MRGVLANPGEGVVGRVRRLRGSYGALWVAGRRSGQAVVALGIGLFPLAAAVTA